MLKSGDIECTDIAHESSDDPSHCLYICEAMPTSSKEFSRTNLKSLKKVKKYQIEGTYSDEDEELKRLNAKRAHYLRVKKKIKDLETEEELKKIKEERDSLKFEKSLWQKEKEFYIEKEKQWDKEKQSWEKERSSYLKQLDSYLSILQNLSQKAD